MGSSPAGRAKSATTQAVSPTTSTFRTTSTRIGSASCRTRAANRTGWIGIVSATATAASQNCGRGRSATRGTSQTTYWIE
ncbi:MAG: hypothetical protein E6G61_06635 [Actinobacteria bacterium]|nr:MAG: hypothetical protein E6G61_06635 [Actinomycetota bacterium]